MGRARTTCLGQHLKADVTSRRNASGFTLAELLITISIAAILTMLAVPSYHSITEKHRAKSAAVDIYLALLKTRSEAVHRNASVTLSPKSGDWSNGWQILNPSDNSLLEDHIALRGVTLGGPASVIYNSSGRLQGAASSFDILSTGTAAVGRCVTIDPSGRPYTKKSSC